jgi:hypothetical protein
MRLLALALIAVPATAAASPWTLPQGEVVLDASYNYQLATREFFESGPARSFPLRGKYDASSVRLAARVGLTDRLEVELALPLVLVAYRSDPVILLPRDPAGALGELDYYQENIIDLSRTAAGISDIDLAARYQWLGPPFVLATELRIKTPTGYDAPSGTFGDRPESIAEFSADPGRFVGPENVRDDVTLGDGQLDLAATLLLGYSITDHLFARVDAGYRLRLGGAGDQFVGAFRTGYLFGDRLLLFGSVSLTKTVGDADVIGVSAAAVDPELPATEYGGLTNLLLREVRLERDVLNVDFGVLLRVTSEVELKAAYQRVLWGRNTAVTDGVTIGISVRASLLAAPESL